MPLDHCASSPFGENALASAVVDFFDVVVHVFDQQDVIVQHRLVFRVVGASLARRGVVCTSWCSSGRRLFGNSLEAVEHGTIDARVGVVNESANFGHAIAGTIIVCTRNGGEDVLDCSAKVWEDSHEGNHTLTLVNLDFRLLDCANLVVDEFSEQGLQTHGQLVEELQEVILCGVCEEERVLAECSEDTNTLDRVGRHGPVEQGGHLLSEEREGWFHGASLAVWT